MRGRLPARMDRHRSLDQSKDAGVLAVQLGALTDGTSYTAQTTLEAAAKNIRASSRTQAIVHSPR